LDHAFDFSAIAEQGGVASEEAEATEALQQAAIARARDLGVDHLKLRHRLV